MNSFGITQNHNLKNEKKSDACDKPLTRQLHTDDKWFNWIHLTFFFSLKLTLLSIVSVYRCEQITCLSKFSNQFDAHVSLYENSINRLNSFQTSQYTFEDCFIVNSFENSRMLCSSLLEGHGLNGLLRNPCSNYMKSITFEIILIAKIVSLNFMHKKFRKYLR